MLSSLPSTLYPPFYRALRRSETGLVSSYTIPVPVSSSIPRPLQVFETMSAGPHILHICPL